MGNNRKGNEPIPASELLDFAGVGGLIHQGINSANEARTKNRIILLLLVALIISLVVNGLQATDQPEPKLLGETTDGRIRPLPLLNDPMYSHREIGEWAQRCVQKLYRLSYVDWRETLQNESLCLSDGSRAAFVESLKTVGVFDMLKPDMQGMLYAIPSPPVIRNAGLGAKGYQVWVVDVPYRINLDGKKKGTLDVVMTMQIRRVSLTWREDGLWVENFKVRPKAGGAR